MMSLMFAKRHGFTDNKGNKFIGLLYQDTRSNRIFSMAYNLNDDRTIYINEIDESFSPNDNTYSTVSAGTVSEAKEIIERDMLTKRNFLALNRRMTMKTCFAFALVACICFTGCNPKSATSMNKKMAYADSGATLAAAVAIDQIPQEKFDDAKVEIIKMCEDLKKFLDDGMIVDLPIDKAKQAVEQYMIKKGWAAYISLVDLVFAWVETQHIPVDKIGPNNILIIKQGLDGVARQASRSKKEWAIPVSEQKVDTTRNKSLKIK